MNEYRYSGAPTYDSNPFPNVRRMWKRSYAETRYGKSFNPFLTRKLVKKIWFSPPKIAKKFTLTPKLVPNPLEIKKNSFKNGLSFFSSKNYTQTENFTKSL